MKNNKLIFIIVFVLFVCGCEYYYVGHKAELNGPYDVQGINSNGIVTMYIDGAQQDVALIGIESVNEKGIELMEEKLMGKEAYLEYGADTLDDEGNTLAYVYLKDKQSMVQKLLLKGDMATAGELGSNQKYADDFAKWQK